MSGESAYVWWPTHRDDVVDIGDARNVPTHLVVVGALTVVLCLPIVTRATGISATSVIALIGAHLAWYLVGAYVLAPGRPSIGRANLLMAGNLTVNVVVAVAIPVAAKNPATPLWMLPIVYACMNGALQERERCITFLLAHALSPLVALPVLARHGSEWSIAAPLLCGALCAVSYNHLAGVSARWRVVRAEQNAALAALRSQIAARDRERLLLDLRDSIGSTLSIVGMYGDMVERHAERPEELRTVAAMVREAARSGLGEVRGLIRAMAPVADTVAELAATLRQVGARAADGTELAIVVSVDGAEVTVSGANRLAVVRAFQDAIRAARQGSARRVVAQLASDRTTTTLEIEDDAGCVTTHPTREARMVEHVAELGGTYARAPAAVQGTIVRIVLPR